MGLSDAWDSFLDFAQEKGLPLRSLGDALEEKGIPSISLLVIGFLAVAGILGYFFVLPSYQEPAFSRVAISVMSGTNPVFNATVILTAKDGSESPRKCVTDSSGKCFIDKVGFREYEVTGVAADFEILSDSFFPRKASESISLNAVQNSLSNKVSLSVQVEGPESAVVSLFDSEGKLLDTRTGLIVFFSVSPRTNYVVRAEAEGFVKSEQAVFVSDSDKNIEFSLNAVSVERIGSLLVSVVDSTGKGIAFASVEVKDLVTGKRLCNLSTDSGGKASCRLAMGLKTVVSAFKKGFLVGNSFANISSAENAVSISLEEASADSSGKLVLRIVGESKEAISNPFVRLYLGNSSVGEEIPPDGVARFDVRKGLNYFVTVFKPGFLPRWQRVSAGEHLIVLFRASSENSGSLNVSVTDFEANDVAEAFVSIFNSDGTPLGIIERITDLDGKTFFESLPSGNFLVKASKSGRRGSALVSVKPGVSSIASIVLERGRGRAFFKVVDSFSKKPVESALIQVFKAKNAVGSCTTNSNGSCAVELEEGSASARVSKQGFEPLETAEFLVRPGVDSVNEVELLNKTAFLGTKLYFAGAFDSFGKRVSELEPNKVYSLKFILSAPSFEFSKAIAHVRLGLPSSSLESENAEIVSYDGGSARVLSGLDYSYSPEFGSSESSVSSAFNESGFGLTKVSLSSKSVSSFKWLQFEYPSFVGSKEFEVRLKTKSVGKADVFYRTAFYSGGKVVRDPVDEQAGVSKNEFLASANKLSLGISFQGDCVGSYCVQLTCGDSSGSKSSCSGFEARAGDSFRVFFKNSFPNSSRLSLRTESESVVLENGFSKAGSSKAVVSSSGLQEIIVSVNAEDEGFFSVKALKPGTRVDFIVSSIGGDASFQKSFFINTFGQVGLKVDVSPKTLFALEKTKLVFKVSDSIGLSVSDARISVEGTPIEGVQEASLESGSSNTYSLSIQPQGIGEISYSVEAPGYKKVFGKIPVNSEKLFSLSSNKLSLEVNSKESRSIGFSTNNLLNNELRVTLYFIKSPAKYTSLDLNPGVFKIKPKESFEATLSAQVSQEVLELAQKNNLLTEKISGKIRVEARAGKSLQTEEIPFTVSTAFEQKAIDSIWSVEESELSFSLTPPESSVSKTLKVSNNGPYQLIINQEPLLSGISVEPISLILFPGESKEFIVSFNNFEKKCIKNTVSRKGSLSLYASFQGLSSKKSVRLSTELMGQSDCVTESKAVASPTPKYSTTRIAFPLNLKMIFPPGTESKRAQDGSTIISLPNGDAFIFFTGASASDREAEVPAGTLFEIPSKYALPDRLVLPIQFAVELPFDSDISVSQDRSLVATSFSVGMQFILPPSATPSFNSKWSYPNTFGNGFSINVNPLYGEGYLNGYSKPQSFSIPPFNPVFFRPIPAEYAGVPNGVETRLPVPISLTIPSSFRIQPIERLAGSSTQLSGMKVVFLENNEKIVIPSNAEIVRQPASNLVRIPEKTILLLPPSLAEKIPEGFKIKFPFSWAVSVEEKHRIESRKGEYVLISSDNETALKFPRKPVIQDKAVSVYPNEFVSFLSGDFASLKDARAGREQETSKTDVIIDFPPKTTFSKQGEAITADLEKCAPVRERTSDESFEKIHGGVEKVEFSQGQIPSKAKPGTPTEEETSVRVPKGTLINFFTCGSEAQTKTVSFEYWVTFHLPLNTEFSYGEKTIAKLPECILIKVEENKESKELTNASEITFEKDVLVQKTDKDYVVVVAPGSKIVFKTCGKGMKPPSTNLLIELGKQFFNVTPAEISVTITDVEGELARLPQATNSEVKLVNEYVTELDTSLHQITGEPEFVSSTDASKIVHQTSYQQVFKVSSGSSIPLSITFVAPSSVLDAWGCINQEKEVEGLISWQAKALNGYSSIKGVKVKLKFVPDENKCWHKVRDRISASLQDFFVNYDSKQNNARRNTEMILSFKAPRHERFIALINNNQYQEKVSLETKYEPESKRDLVNCSIPPTLDAGQAIVAKCVSGTPRGKKDSVNIVITAKGQSSGETIKVQTIKTIVYNPDPAVASLYPATPLGDLAPIKIPEPTETPSTSPTASETPSTPSSSTSPTPSPSPSPSPTPSSSPSPTSTASSSKQKILSFQEESDSVRREAEEEAGGTKSVPDDFFITCEKLFCDDSQAINAYASFIRAVFSYVKSLSNEKSYPIDIQRYCQKTGNKPIKKSMVLQKSNGFLSPNFLQEIAVQELSELRNRPRIQGTPSFEGCGIWVITAEIDACLVSAIPNYQEWLSSRSVIITAKKEVTCPENTANAPLLMTGGKLLDNQLGLERFSETNLGGTRVVVGRRIPAWPAEVAEGTKKMGQSLFSIGWPPNMKWLEFLLNPSFFAMGPYAEEPNEEDVKDAKKIHEIIYATPMPHEQGISSANYYSNYEFCISNGFRQIGEVAFFGTLLSAGISLASYGTSAFTSGLTLLPGIVSQKVGTGLITAGTICVPEAIVYAGIGNKVCEAANACVLSAIFSAVDVSVMGGTAFLSKRQLYENAINSLKESGKLGTGVISGLRQGFTSQGWVMPLVTSGISGGLALSGTLLDQPDDFVREKVGAGPGSAPVYARALYGRGVISTYEKLGAKASFTTIMTKGAREALPVFKSPSGASSLYHHYDAVLAKGAPPSEAALKEAFRLWISERYNALRRNPGALARELRTLFRDDLIPRDLASLDSSAISNFIEGRSSAVLDTLADNICSSPAAKAFIGEIQMPKYQKSMKKALLKKGGDPTLAQEISKKIGEEYKNNPKYSIPAEYSEEAYNHVFREKFNSLIEATENPPFRISIDSLTSSVSVETNLPDLDDISPLLDPSIEDALKNKVVQLKNLMDNLKTKIHDMRSTIDTSLLREFDDIITTFDSLDSLIHSLAAFESNYLSTLPRESILNFRTIKRQVTEINNVFTEIKESLNLLKSNPTIKKQLIESWLKENFDDDFARKVMDRLSDSELDEESISRILNEEISKNQRAIAGRGVYGVMEDYINKGFFVSEDPFSKTAREGPLGGLIDLSTEYADEMHDAYILIEDSMDTAEKNRIRQLRQELTRRGKTSNAINHKYLTPDLITSSSAYDQEFLNLNIKAKTAIELAETTKYPSDATNAKAKISEILAADPSKIDDIITKLPDDYFYLDGTIYDALYELAEAKKKELEALANLKKTFIEFKKSPVLRRNLIHDFLFENFDEKVAKRVWSKIEVLSTADADDFAKKVALIFEEELGETIVTKVKPNTNFFQKLFSKEGLKGFASMLGVGAIELFLSMLFHVDVRPVHFDVGPEVVHDLGVTHFETRFFWRSTFPSFHEFCEKSNLSREECDVRVFKVEGDLCKEDYGMCLFLFKKKAKSSTDLGDVQGYSLLLVKGRGGGQEAIVASIVWPDAPPVEPSVLGGRNIRSEFVDAEAGVSPAD